MFKRTRYFLLALAIILATASGIPAQDQPAALNTDTAKVNGVELGYRTIGSGPPLLMITGYGATMDSWDAVLIDKLSKKFQVIIFDNRGMGYSSSNDEKLTISLMADDATGLLDALGMAKADVLSWSMGSMIAQEMALNYPGKVNKLILYATACTNKAAKGALDHVAKTQAKPLVERYFPAEWANQNPDALERMPKPSIPPSAATAARQSTACIEWQGSEQRLPGLSKSVLLIVGEEDDITPPSQSVHMARLIPGAWLARFKGGSHFLQYQVPEDFAQVVAIFLTTDQNLIKQGQ